MDLLVGTAWTNRPCVHTDDVAVGTVNRLGELNQTWLVEIFEKEGISVEGCVDAPLEVPSCSSLKSMSNAAADGSSRSESSLSSAISSALRILGK